MYDHSHDGTMARAIESAGLKIASETIEPDSQGFGTNAHLLLEGYACRIWIHQLSLIHISRLRWAEGAYK